MPVRKGPVAGVILAAGSSTRMGRNKLLLKLGGQSVLRGAAKRALEAGLSPVIVVLGHEAEGARQELAGLPCETVLNPDHERGVNGSMRVGIARVPEEAQAAVVILADMPLVTPDMITALVRTYREDTAPLVVSSYGDVSAPPVLYDRALFVELLTTEGEGCGKHVVKRHQHEARVLSWPEAALADLDRPEDYEKIQVVLEAAGRAQGH